MNENDSVSIDPLILQDQAYKSRHYIFERIIRDKEKGVVRNVDSQKSEELFTNLFWVKFHVAAIRIEEKYLIKEEQ